MLAKNRKDVGLYIITNMKNVAINYIDALSEGLIRGCESVECMLENDNV